MKTVARQRKRRLGRPPLPASERQDAVLFLRLRPGELAALRRLARAARVTPGVYARAVLRDHLAQRR
jgi:hypothetical protein